MEEDTSKWSTLKKVILISIVGVVLITSILGMFIPEISEYSLKLIKILLDSIATIATI